jgi:hypothetical protein
MMGAAAAQNSGPMDVSVSPPAANGVYDTEVHLAQSDPVTATPAGGLGPYTYAWTWISGNVVAVIPTSHDQTVFFSSGFPITSVYRVTVTDSLGASDFVDVPVSVH